jgi:hypothetical protein
MITEVLSPIFWPRRLYRIPGEITSMTTFNALSGISYTACKQQFDTQAQSKGLLIIILLIVGAILQLALSTVLGLDIIGAAIITVATIMLGIFLGKVGQYVALAIIPPLIAIVGLVILMFSIDTLSLGGAVAAWLVEIIAGVVSLIVVIVVAIRAYQVSQGPKGSQYAAFLAQKCGSK